MLRKSLAAARSLVTTFTGASRSVRARRTGRNATRPSLEGLEERVVLTSLPPGFTESLVATGLGKSNRDDVRARWPALRPRASGEC